VSIWQIVINPMGWWSRNVLGSNRGFASMDEQRQREAASKGGQASGGNFKNDPERAVEAGRKGGQGVAGEERSFARGESRRAA
jgi:general stress protein YciG